MAKAAERSSSAKTGTGRSQPDTSLSQARIVAVARALMETSGVESVTMRRVASILNVTAMALYHHVADKQALIALVADQVMNVVETADGENAPWHERLRASFIAVHNEINRYPGLGLYISATNGFYPSGLLQLKRVHQLLVEAGLDGSEAKQAVYFMLTYHAGYFVMKHSVQRLPLSIQPAGEEDAFMRLGAKGTFVTDDAFLRGLDTMIAGFRAQIAAKGIPSEAR